MACNPLTRNCHISHFSLGCMLLRSAEPTAVVHLSRRPSWGEYHDFLVSQIKSTDACIDLVDINLVEYGRPKHLERTTLTEHYGQEPTTAHHSGTQWIVCRMTLYPANKC